MNALEHGTLTVGRWRGIPLRINWTFLLLMLFVGGSEPWAWLGVLLLIAGHELGHAAMVLAVGARAREVMVAGFGGYCRWDGAVSAKGRAIIAWGGAWAQLLMLALAFALSMVWPARTQGQAVLYDVFIRTNLFLLALNLLPFPPLDGKEAWPLVGYLRDDVRRWWARRRLRVVRSKPSTKPAEPSAPKRSQAETERIFGQMEAELTERKLRDLPPPGPNDN